MELIRGLVNLQDRQRGCVVTIGTYDGIHLGHQALLRRVSEHAARLSAPTVLLTFEPTPREFLSPEAPPARLTSLRERCRVLAGMSLDYLLLLRFGEGLRNLSGEAFAQLLAQGLGARTVVVGHDFRFGCHGEATAPMLVKAGRRLGFSVDVVPPVLVEGERVSSSALRDALERGEFELVQRRLGRPYSMRGRVVPGQRLGRNLGFPTANLRIERRRAPLKGIYAVRVHGIEAGPLAAVASLGTRPTVGGVHTLLEVHVFDFAADLYGRELEVEFVRKLRDEEHFPTLDALVEQIHRDAAEARRILGA
ncbi:MAG TPA: bifunctional riboflavin kinase/FAD synthetase [Steroidobacteraceae bacterium]|nr:bifunctional riboflavin kinase/FAD synthetase [Steroidobacteraceae bacterium]